jgi:hypothetical protein
VQFVRAAGPSHLESNSTSPPAFLGARLRWANGRRTICPPPRPSGRGPRWPRRPELSAIQLGQLSQLGLERLPRGHAGPDPRAQGLRHVVPGGGPGRPPKAHIEMGAVLRPGLATAPGPAAGAVGLGEGTEQGLAGEGQEAAEQGVASPSGGRNRCHRLRSYRDARRPPRAKCVLRPCSARPGPHKHRLKCLSDPDTPFPDAVRQPRSRDTTANHTVFDNVTGGHIDLAAGRLSRVLRELREAKGFTQVELAEKANVERRT